MTNAQKIAAFLFLVIIGGVLLYAAFQDSTYIEISIKKGVPWDFVRNTDWDKLLDDIRAYIGLFSIGLGIFVILGRSYGKDEHILRIKK